MSVEKSDKTSTGPNVLNCQTCATGLKPIDWSDAKPGFVKIINKACATIDTFWSIDSPTEKDKENANDAWKRIQEILKYFIKNIPVPSLKKKI